MSAGHRFTLRVYYEDTDAGGVVYHANYLRFAERARSELLREAGFDHRGLARQHDTVLAVRRCEIAFERAARLDDALEVLTRIERWSGARLVFAQTIHKEQERLAELRVEVAVLDATLRPRRCPPVLRQRLGDLLAASSGLASST